MACRRSDGIDDLDELLERQVRMREGGEILIAGVVEQFRERRRRVHLGSKCQGVHEHPHERVERLVSTSRDGRTDSDVGAVSQPCK
ncbi:hypothetical protein BKP42_20700 [Rhodococcus erythropolis]|nr:hypothetical protein BKP42_20700 [Rhodococcus erythropolis]